MKPSLQKITPSLWYSKEAEEPARFYASIFPYSRVAEAMLKMVKLDVAGLQAAYDGR